MIRLTRVELRRLFARTLVLLAMLAAVAVAGLTLVVTAGTVHPLSDAELAQAERHLEQALEDWEEHGAEQEAQCREQQEIESELAGEEIDFGCDQMAPQRQWYVPQPPSFAEYLPAILATLSALLVLIPLMIGATATAAEHSTGAITNWLTFEPRRLRVYGSKVLAPALGVIPMGVVVLAVTIAGTWLIFDGRGLTAAMTDAAWADIGWTAARILAVAVLAAATGAALGFLLRHFAAVLGVVVGYAVAIEGILANLVEGLRPWTVSMNLTAWVDGEAVYHVTQCTPVQGGTTCDWVEHTISMGQGATYLVVLAAVIVVVAALVFRRRDAA